jgi:hypothetical protein
MKRDNRRITLVCRSSSAPQRAWMTSRNAPRRIIFVESFKAIPFALAGGIEQTARDIEAVIVDGAATAAQYLQLLSTLPMTYNGDVVLIGDESAFVSAAGRGGDRVLYALRPGDVLFYLETKQLIAPPSEALPAPQCRPVLSSTPAS